MQYIKRAVRRAPFTQKMTHAILLRVIHDRAEALGLNPLA